MKITRDSAVLTLGILGALVGYLAAAQHTPLEWTFHEWMQFALMGIGVIAGKLSTSPLKGEHD
jgi:hypothetical protein